MPAVSALPRGMVSACYCSTRAFIVLPRNSPSLLQPSPSPLLLGATLLLRMGFSTSTGPQHPSPSWCSGVGTTLLDPGPLPPPTIPRPVVALPARNCSVVAAVERQVLLLPAPGLSPLPRGPSLCITALLFQVHCLCNWRGVFRARLLLFRQSSSPAPAVRLRKLLAVPPTRSPLRSPAEAPRPHGATGWITGLFCRFRQAAA